MVVSARTVKTRERRGRTALLRAALPLAFWRMRRTWGLLLVAQFGMIAAGMLVWAVPIFGQVALVAGLQGLVDSTPGLDTFYGSIQMAQPTAPLLTAFDQSAATLRTGDLRAWHLGDPRIELRTGPLRVANPQALAAVVINAEQGPLLAGDLRVVSGRLPLPSASALEVVVTQAAASHLGVAPGDELRFRLAPAPMVRVVGIVASTNPAFATDRGSYLATVDLNDNLRNYAQDNKLDFILTSNEAITTYTAAYDWPPSPATSSTAGASPNTSPLWQGWWIARADFAHMSGRDLQVFLAGSPTDFGRRLNLLMIRADAAAVQQAGVVTSATSGDFNHGADYGDYTTGADIQIVLIWFLLAEILGVVLLALGQMAGLLVERQEPLIATLRSRGASRGQIFGAFTIQMLVLALTALAAGAALAFPVVRLVAEAVLPASEQRALSVLDGGAFTFGTAAVIAAAVAMLVTLVVMLRATGRAVALNALSLRREAARPTRQPLWRRLHLDVLAAILALAGYGVLAFSYDLVTRSRTPGQLGGALDVLLGLLALIAPMFLMVAGALLFLRAAPPLLRLGERLAARGRGVVGTLALAQLARAMRQTMRIVLPLALATCFAVYALAAHAAILGHVEDAAALQAGADFSGRMTTAVANTSVGTAARTAAYADLAGVRSATLGYRGATLTGACNLYSTTCSGVSNPIQIAAVDPAGFAATAIWPAEDAALPLAPLMARLAAARDSAIATKTVPAILDDGAAAVLGVRTGATFALYAPTTNGAAVSGGEASAPAMRFAVLAVVPYLPGLEATAGNGGGNVAPAGLLADYASFAAAYSASGADTSVVAPNYVWLRTASDRAALAGVRAALASGTLAIGPLAEFVYDNSALQVNDRRAIVDDDLSGAGYLILVGVVALGAAAALLLALCGALIASLVAARERGLSFALLRALGAEPRRIWRLVAWEHGIVYATALALGVGLGAVLAAVTVAPLSGLIVGTSDLAVRAVWPWPELGAMVGVLALICVVATTAGAWVAARPSLGAILRLNQD